MTAGGRRTRLLLLAAVALSTGSAGCTGGEGPPGAGHIDVFELVYERSWSGPPAVGLLDDRHHYELYVGGTDGGTLVTNWGSSDEGERSLGDLCDGCHVAAAAFGDLTGDHRTDLVVATLSHGVHLFAGDGTGSLAGLEQPAGFADVQGLAVAPADVDNDGDLDLGVASTAGGLHLFENRGNASFAPPVVLTGAKGHAFTFLYADDDGLLDLVAATPTGLVLYANDPADPGAFHPASDGRAVLDSPVVLTLAAVDLDDDQRLDVLTAGEAGIRVLRNLGQLDFEQVPEPEGLLRFGGHIAAAPVDLDNDGRLEVLAAPFHGGLHVYDRDATDAWQLTLDTPHATEERTPARGLVVADVERDHRLDVANVGQRGTTFVYHAPYPPRASFATQLRGNQSNHDGIGAVLTLAADPSVQLRQVGGLASNVLALPPDVHVGLGEDPPDEVVLSLRWPSGIQQTQRLELEALLDRTLMVAEAPGEDPRDAR